MNNSPQLSQVKTNTPMLGGDRAIPVPCPRCGETMIRDFFGNQVCLPCIQVDLVFRRAIETGVCEKCGGEFELYEYPENILHADGSWYFIEPTITGDPEIDDMEYMFTEILFCLHCEAEWERFTDLR